MVFGGVKFSSARMWHNIDVFSGLNTYDMDFVKRKRLKRPKDKCQLLRMRKVQHTLGVHII